jgi:AAA domain
MSWKLTAWDSVTDERIWPSIGKRADGQHLFYAGAINMIFGDSNSGKSWIALAICQQEAQAGRHVVYLDYESQARTIKGRLTSIGVTPEQMKRVHHVTCEGSFAKSYEEWLDKAVDKWKPTTLIIDTAGEAQSAQADLTGSEADMIVKWRKMLPERYAQLGLCVIEIDHTGVSWEAADRVQGSFRKKAGLTGISILASADKAHPHKKGVRGRTKLICRKDREGTYAIKEVVADFWHEDDDYGKHGSVAFELHDPLDDVKPEPVGVRCARAIQENGLEGLSHRETCARIKLLNLPYGDTAVRQARAILAAEEDAA